MNREPFTTQAENKTSANTQNERFLSSVVVK